MQYMHYIALHLHQLHWDGEKILRSVQSRAGMQSSVNNDADADSAVTLGWGDDDGPGRAPDVQHYGHVLRPGELGRDGGAQGEAAGRQLHHTTGQIKFIHISKN